MLWNNEAVGYNENYILKYLENEFWKLCHYRLGDLILCILMYVCRKYAVVYVYIFILEIYMVIYLISKFYQPWCSKTYEC